MEGKFSSLVLVVQLQVGMDGRRRAAFAIHSQLWCGLFESMIVLHWQVAAAYRTIASTKSSKSTRRAPNPLLHLISFVAMFFKYFFGNGGQQVGARLFGSRDWQRI
jgi:hypothetical protein